MFFSFLSSITQFHPTAFFIFFSQNLCINGNFNAECYLEELENSHVGLEAVDVEVAKYDRKRTREVMEGKMGPLFDYPDIIWAKDVAGVKVQILENAESFSNYLERDS